MSQNSNTRFVHLLQPIRDLTKNWDIDVASQLEEYIEEIEQITISFDGGNTTMNFAEAALLIQGTTCIYSKKVEYLYAMVYQTLDLIASKRRLAQASSVDDQGQDKDVTFAQSNDTEEFLSLDMVEAKNIDMDENRNKNFMSAGATIPRTPMSLIPLQDMERASSTPLLSRTGEVLGSRVDFKMNTSAVHCSGALLLEPINHFMLSVKMTGGREPIAIRYDTPMEKLKDMLHSSTNTTSALQHEDADLFDGVCYDDGGDGGGMDFSGDEEAGVSHHSDCGPAASARRPRPLRVRIEEDGEPIDPWKLLDPHDKGPTADNKPFRKGTTCKVLPSLSKKKNKKRKDTVDMPEEALSAFILRSVYSCSSMFPKNRLKAPISSEFEGYYWAELKNRLKQKRQDNIKLIQMRKEHALMLEQEALKEEEVEQDNVEDYHHLGDDYSDDDVNQDGIESGFEGAFHNFAMGDGIQDNLIAMAIAFQGVEPMALDELSGNNAQRQMNYEDLVKNYVESTMEGVQAYIHETELSKRVQQWEDKIRPELALEEQYPAFDIHDCGAKIIKELQQDQDQDHSESSAISFFNLMNNKKHYDISRMFAASLQLANSYNIKIDCVPGKTGDDSVNTMMLTLLNTELSHEAISSYKAPSLHD